MAKRGQAIRKPPAGRKPPPRRRKFVPKRAPAGIDPNQEVATLRRQLSEALQQQTATADVLKVISRSTFDLQAVLQTLVESAARLCEADLANIWRPRGTAYRLAASFGIPGKERERIENKEYLESIAIEPGRGSLVGRTLLEKRTVQIADVQTDPDYKLSGVTSIGDYRTMLGVPLLREGDPIGVIFLTRCTVQPFTDRQIELVTTFADQAVIAIENVRLFDEVQAKTRDLTESLEQQTATSEVLQVISSSSGDIAPVFDAMLENATRLCEASYGHVWRFDGELLHSVAVWGDPWFTEWLQEHSPIAPIPGSAADHIARGENVVHVADRREEQAYSSDPVFRGLVDASGMRASLSAALRLDGALIGIINVYRQEVRPFSDKQIALLQNFAAQAVVAMENARHISETRAALERQTATAEVLQVINSSPGNLAPVFDAILDKAHHLCGVSYGSLQLYDGESFRAVAVHGLSPAFADRLRQGYMPGPNQPSRRLLEGARFVHVPDLGEIDDPVARAGADLSAIRTTLYIPLRKNGTLLGSIVAARQEVRPFTEKEIALLESFAGQAVIAMENARLLGELRERQAELRVTFDNMGDGVVMFGADTRLVAWNRNFQEILDLPDAFLAQRPSYSDYFGYLAQRGEYSADLEADLNRLNEDPRQELRLERTRPDGRVVEVRRNPVPGGGFVLIYSDITARKRAEETIRAARDAAESALRELQTAQASLVHAQKMAALGQLTAGIAHEIKNPLNFVNNFAGLSVELLEELKGAAGDVIHTLDAGRRTEILETIAMLTGNLEKIVEHGRRADGIVRSMLQHSRGSSGDWQATDLNALVEEALNLAYHGARAQDPNFDITLERDLDRDLASVDAVPQELSRVLLNLMGNGFYAVNKRSREGDSTFRPALKVATLEFGDRVEVRVRDNGIGIPPENRDKLFQPFFTTKPTGEGTGLGLSISYEIVTQQHGGTITVDSEVGDFTEFTVRLPRSGRMVAR